MLESAYVFGDPSPYRAWLRNLARAANSSESVHDAGHALLEVRGLSYGFDARGTTSSEEMLLRSHDLPSVRGGSVSETNRTDYMALLRSPGAGLSLDDVVQRLRREPESKSATVQFPVTATAKPCLTTLDFKLRNGHIELTAFFRSQDVWRRQPANNAFLLDCVRLVAIQLGVQPGLVRVVVASAHVQEADLPGIQTFLHHAFVAVLDVPSDRPAVVAVVGRERPHGDLAGKPQAYFEAYSIGIGLGANGFVILTGGLGGIMAAAARGASDVSGVSVGVLPTIPKDEAHERAPNPYQTVGLATGLDQRARIPIIVDSCDGMVVVNGGGGTRIEAHLALAAGKPVIALANSGGVAEELLSAQTGPTLHRAEDARDVVEQCMRLWPGARAFGVSPC